MLIRLHAFAGIAIVTASAGCSTVAMGPPPAPAESPITAPAFRPFGDGRNWILTEPMTYRVGDTQDSVVIPKGFVTDFASIPQALQIFVSALGRYNLPAVMHDYLYWEQRCTKEQSDRLFNLAMVEMNVSRGRRRRIFGAVHRFGNGAWRENEQDRSAGLPRIVPDSGVRAIDPLETWAQYREYLRSAGVRPDSTNEVSTQFCERGSQRR